MEMQQIMEVAGATGYFSKLSISGFFAACSLMGFRRYVLLFMQKGKTWTIRDTIIINQGNMEAKMEATRRELQSQLGDVAARAEWGRGTEACASIAQPPKFNGTTSWAVFRHQFETVAEHNSWTRQEKSTYLITVLQGRATDMLRGNLKGATYEVALEVRFGNQHFAATYRS
jgi:hypothetical protein